MSKFIFGSAPLDFQELTKCEALRFSLTYNIPTINMHYYFNIGSNLGDKDRNLHQAVKLLEKALTAPAKVSSFIESKAWGFESENTFLNAGVMIESDIKPHDMLKITQQIERDMGSITHRNDDGSYKDRLIDIDIIAIDDLIINTPELTVPHPRMHLRDFVMRPMTELAPQWVHPIFHAKIKT